MSSSEARQTGRQRRAAPQSGRGGGIRKRWRVAPPVPLEISTRFPEFDPLLLQLLWNRGIATQAAVDAFLNPDYGQDVGDPFAFRDMHRAVERLIRAIDADERIIVYGDYDADGICGAALLSETLRKLGATVDVYLPDRLTEGYGLNIPAIEQFARDKTSVLVSVDCGITNVQEVAHANARGMDVLIVDHHHEPPQLPAAQAILNPVVTGETYPFRGFCGTGVAFKLAQALLIGTRDGQALRRPRPVAHGWEKWLLDLVAIATVADFSPLTGENRTLVTYGLLVLKKTRRKGLRALFALAGIAPQTITTATVAYQIAPRLNAAGRMQHASAALFLLTTEDPARARAIAEELHQTNAERQRVTEALASAALAQIGPNPSDALLTAVGDGWQAGVIGIVAGRILNRFHRPVLIMGRDGETVVGSGRSIPQYNIIEALERARAHLDKFGGHPQACGFTIQGRDKLARFLDAMQADARATLSPAAFQPTLAVDATVTLRSAAWQVIDLQAKLEPYGEGNPRPVFAAEGLTVASVTAVGANGNHVRVTVDDAEGERAVFIGFGYGDARERLAVGTAVDLAFELDVNEWNGNRELQRKILDVRPHGSA